MSPHSRDEPCNCDDDDGSCYWDGWGTASGHRGPIGPVGTPCDHEWKCTKCGVVRGYV